MDREPLSEKKTQDIYKLIYELKQNNNIRVGCNEAIKAINSNSALLVVVANDAVPQSITEPLPVLCEQKGVDCVFVGSKTALGKACRLEIDVAACAIYTRKEEDSSRIQEKIAKALK